MWRPVFFSETSERIGTDRFHIGLIPRILEFVPGRLPGFSMRGKTRLLRKTIRALHPFYRVKKMSDF
jgi:hypothetical protein